MLSSQTRNLLQRNWDQPIREAPADAVLLRARFLAPTTVLELMAVATMARMDYFAGVAGRPWLTTYARSAASRRRMHSWPGDQRFGNRGPEWRLAGAALGAVPAPALER